MKFAASWAIAIMAIGLPAHGKPVEVNKVFSYCLEPTSMAVAVATNEQKDQPQNRGCTRWSEFAETAAGVTQRTHFVMKNCGGALGRPVNYFARDVINQFRATAKLQEILERPTTAELSTNYRHFGLRELRQGESRVGSLAVWRGVNDGMAGLVYEDRNDPASELSLDKLFISYPGNASKPKACGEVIDSDAATMAKTVALAEDSRKSPRFLTLNTPPLYWNYWIEEVVDAGQNLEQPPSVDTIKLYRFRVSLSSLDFSSWQPGRTDRQPKLTLAQAKALIPAMESRAYIITILPSPPMVVMGNGDPFVVHPSTERLQESLTEPPVADVSLRSVMAARHDALKTDKPGGIALDFTVRENEPCAFFSVVVADTNGNLVSSWSQNLRVSASSDEECAVSRSASRRMDIVSLFDVAVDESVAAQLAFMEFPGNAPRTVGMFSETGKAPVTWLLNTKSLTMRLVDMARDINRVVGNGNFSLDTWARQLGNTILFQCSNLKDDQCPGMIARERLFEIAGREAQGSKARIQVSLRDARNSRFYLPATIMGTPDGQLLGQKVDVVQPLARPGSRLGTNSGCVNRWSGSFLIAEADDPPSTPWRANWWSGLGSVPQSHTEFKALQDYLNAQETSTGAEGLVVMAHHGARGISDMEIGGQLVVGDDIRRTFGRNSFAVLAMCSVGALGDANERNSSILDKLNAANMRAVISSPFALPLAVAKGFLSHLRTQITTAGDGKTLREIFNAARESLRNSTMGAERLSSVKEAMETFMLLGDGEVKVCN